MQIMILINKLILNIVFKPFALFLPISKFRKRCVAVANSPLSDEKIATVPPTTP